MKPTFFETAPPCPECGSERIWYGSVELWVRGGTHSNDDNLNTAVCTVCGYTSFYLENLPKMVQQRAEYVRKQELQRQKELKKQQK